MKAVLSPRLSPKSGKLGEQWIIWGLCWLPFFSLFFVDLGANPVEWVLQATGLWGLQLLLLTLAMSPLRRMTSWTLWIRSRRTLGLAAFAYLCLHIAIYSGLERGLVLNDILDDIAKRPYIAVGFAAFLLLIPLAITSTQAWMKALGKHWRRLHRLSYLAALLGVVHFAWLVKIDLTEPLMYAAALLVLLAWRLPWPRRPVGKAPAVTTTTTRRVAQ